MFFAIRQQRYRSSSAAVGARFIAPAYTYSPRIRNSFRMHSRNVRNVFVICVLHIRRVKVWFLRCKSMVFGVQKGGFYIAKVWFLFFECCVVAICLECYHNPSATKWQSVRNVLANPSAAVGDRFIAPAYMKTPTKWGKKMRVW
ncbi:hypothetical protein [Prevotella pallens]|uniref:hypothetical protein n=1 Tax=Prevotella pallens TaxID=60133 RepID=UPI001CAADB78|nr:hypothetical protein [Prevotella pallens]MBF1452173.1 hypothetical protein [Prevotella pallens]